MRQRLVASVSSLLLTLGVLAVLGVAAAPSASAATQVIPIPTSASGAESIVASPDGTLWFVEREANKVGRVNADGSISEFALPAASPGISQTEDLDVAPDGSVWILYDSGEYARHLAPDGRVIRDLHIGATQGAPGGGYPYGKEVRVAGDGTAWITMNFNEQFVTLANDAGYRDVPNAPECNDALGRGTDGAFWCRTDSGLTRINASGGGTTYPVNDYAAYPFAIAPGPVGSIWFGRYQRGSFAFSPSEGSVGYLDAGSGAVTSYDTGDRTAINSLIQGPDGNMWFTSIGAAKGIGHIAPNGSGGALTAIGNYAPNSIAFGRDGAVYATDATNNVVIKTSIADLQVTNVDPGEGSVLYGAVPGTIKAGKAPIRVKGNKVALRVACPKDATRGCAGQARLVTTSKKKPKAVTGLKSYSVKAGKKGAVRLKLSKKGLKAVKRGKVTVLRLEIYAPGGSTPVAVKKVKVRR
ncbi:Vgb family protein [Nocardioides flavescens]|uniref:Virginiamycin B lyase n=1 Tax=Nocardioides flavescens TaxID=2691959 RepID=A0A6L7F3S4_9ACTN|nr:hypothetical protein [Nocardioides flavescens]MXG91899.1 hypothetical protein [Nocardioides flavescens]